MCARRTGFASHGKEHPIEPAAANSDAASANEPDQAARKSARKPARIAAAEDWVRMLVELIVGIVICWLLGSTWLLEAFIVPSGSMAPTLLGAHYELTCKDCGLNFVAGGDEPGAIRADCPNCGAPHELETEASPLLDGDRLLVFKLAYLLQDARRWEVVVFRHPEHASIYYIKRIIGLPGETVWIVQGDLFINGTIQRKTLAEQRTLAIPVHDATHASSHEPARWKCDGLETAWQTNPAICVRALEAEATPHVGASPHVAPSQHVAPSEQDWGRGPIDWLHYHHWQRGLGETPIEDQQNYNLLLSRTRAQCSSVSDLLWTGEVRAWGPGELFFRVSDGRTRFELRVQPEQGTARLYHEKVQVAEVRRPGPLFATPTRFEISHMDRQVLVALDGELLFDPFTYEIPASSFSAPELRPLALGGRGVGIEAREFRIFRDVYYADPWLLTLPGIGNREFWGVTRPYQLGPNEFFVLGDNSLNSQDSRYWTRPGVPRSLLVGRPLVVHWPSQEENLLGWQFQVPDFRRIRYIR